MAFLGALGAAEGDEVEALDLGEGTWVRAPGGIFRVTGDVAVPLGPGGLVHPRPAQNDPRVVTLGDEVWALSPSGGVVRIEGEVLVEDARFGSTAGLRAIGGALWVAGLGQVARRDATGAWRVWPIGQDNARWPDGRYPFEMRDVAPDDEEHVLLATGLGLMRMELARGLCVPLPIESRITPDILAMERVGDTLYLAATRGLWVVDLDAGEPLPARPRLDPHRVRGLDVDGDAVMVSTSGSAYRLGTFGFARPVLMHDSPCTPYHIGGCNTSNAVARGEGVVWLAQDARVIAAPITTPDPERCGDWRPPADGPGRSPITDLTLAPDGALWAASVTGLQRLDPATCTGRTWRWPGI